MKVTQEKLPASQLGLEIEVPGDLSKQVYEQTIAKLAKEVRLPGFRQGKVPRHILIQSLGTMRIKATAIEDLVQKGLEKAIKQESIDFLGNSELKTPIDQLIGQFEPGTPLTFAVTVDVTPTPTLKQYTGLALEAEEIKPDPNRVDRVLDDYRKQMATLIPVEDRAAQMDDMAVIDFEGYLDLPEDAPEGAEPEPIPGGTGSDFQVELADGRFIPGFIDGIVGMTPGETKSVAATFPEDYPQADVAGKPATFSITLKEIKTRELPELNDDFAQEVSDFETLAELQAMLEKRYQDEADEKTTRNKHEALYKALVEQIEVELPETLLNREFQEMINQFAMNMSEQGMDVEKILTREFIAELVPQMRPQAIDRLKRTLALREVAKLESIEVDPGTVDSKVQEVLQNASDTKGVNLDRLREVVEADLLKVSVMDWLEHNNVLTLVPEGTLKPKEEGTAGALTEATPEAEAPEADAPEVDAPEVDAPEVDALEVETPEAEASETEVPVV